MRTVPVLFYDDCAGKLPKDKQTQNASVQTMKAYWGSRGIVPLILKVGARLMFVDKSRPPLSHPAVHLIREFLGYFAHLYVLEQRNEVEVCLPKFLISVLVGGHWSLSRTVHFNLYIKPQVQMAWWARCRFTYGRKQIYRPAGS